MTRQQLKKLRREHSISLRRMAKKIGISPSYLCMIENGQKPLPAIVVYKVCLTVGFSYFDIEEQLISYFMKQPVLKVKTKTLHKSVLQDLAKDMAKAILRERWALKIKWS